MESELLYCHEISRRSVARAALHLGVDNMSQDSLDVLADVLQHYMARIGKTVAHLVEASGRTSSHVNVLDILQAIQMTTAPAAKHVHEGGASSVQQRSSTHWQDLAVFLYGTKWEGLIESGAGGKLGPSAPTSNSGGWKAPYFEEVPPFPLASNKVANPHKLKPHVSLSLHADISELEERELEEDDLKNIPDKVFTEWGIVGVKLNGKDPTFEVTSKKEDAKTSAEPDENDSKDDNHGDKAQPKRKLDDEGMADEPSLKRPPYVASFMPSFPSSLKPGRSIVDVPVSTKEMVSQNLLGVRSSLVDLSQKAQYWGSGWDAAPQVPAGLTRPEEQAKIVVPLARASNARVSRILEGSMDAVN